MMPGFPPFRMPVGPFMGGPFPPPGMSMPMAVPMAVPMPTTTPSGGFAWRQVEPGTFSVTSVSVNDEAGSEFKRATRCHYRDLIAVFSGQPGNSTPASINPEQFNAMAQGAAANVFQQLMQGIAAATGRSVKLTYNDESK